MGIKVISKNKKAYHNYQIGDTFEAGIALVGTEVKALRAAKINLGEGGVDISNQEEAWLKDVHIGHYSHGNRQNHDETRPRRLLLKKYEIKRLARKLNEQGFALVPTKVYFKRSYIKVEIGLGKGKKLHDKRESSKAKDANREMSRALKNR